MVAIGCIPAAIIGLAFDDWVNEHFYNKVTVAAMLIVYGVVVHRARAPQPPPPARGRGRPRRAARLGTRAQSYGDVADEAEAALFKITDVDEIDWKTALKIGCFQVLAIIPGTSRSGATIIGGMLSRLFAHRGGRVHVLPGHPHHVRLGPGEVHQVHRRRAWP